MFQISHTACARPTCLAVFKGNKINLAWIESFPYREAKGSTSSSWISKATAKTRRSRRRLASLEPICDSIYCASARSLWRRLPIIGERGREPLFLQLRSSRRTGGVRPARQREQGLRPPLAKSLIIVEQNRGLCAPLAFQSQLIIARRHIAPRPVA